ncbi:ABC transporter substrate-binding protein [Rhizobium sp. BK251]|uniref:ABC transporter substrate-binding protein n=1 Tax=Rhizobium sp. BK251 TaxID=2512125 RepID=UPI00104F9932|nr:ABC transporter substrate-binding protein [Rhizobium sp. BK251]TCL71040.1 glucose/mannose transport system substrate-binding protein [Rhizobium sp. BK251]
MKAKSYGIAAALALTTALASPVVAQETELKVNYTWTSPSETAAIKVLIDALKPKGIKWSDFNVIAHDTGANVTVVNMVSGGTPPDAFMDSIPGLYRDLAGMGLGVPMDDVFNKSGATANFPPAVKSAITVDGKMVKVPIGVQIDGMLYYNLDVAQKAGVDPTKWTSMDDVWKDFDKVKAAGFIPLAIGAQEWQERYLLHALMAGFHGDVYDKFYAEKPDETVFDDPGLKQTIDLVRQFQQHADPAATNRPWNDTTNLVITGKALMQIHGDWIKGEFRNAGKVAGKDFGCIMIPGATGVAVTVDAWGFVKSKDEAVTKAQEVMAATQVDPKVNADFAAAKGSTPVVLNAPTDKLDQCNKVVLEQLADPAKQHPNPNNTADADWYQATGQVIDHFWNDPNMTSEQAIEELRNQYSSIF